ncbi:MAG: adenylate/guanylate cyclase domain-containing protein [Solirubrobacteraceae bacterium]
MAPSVVSASETSPSLAAIVASVDMSLPEFRARTSPDGMMTIVFTDIVGSTEMMERLGEERWIEMMHSHNRLVRDCVARRDGEVVKSQGDGFMIVFASATSALVCGVELQRALARRREENPEEPLPMRIGIHTGNVYRTEDDFLGRAVVLAARITGCANGDEIFVSDDARRYTAARPWRFRRTEQLRLKGLSEVQRVHVLDWP